ncbi:MAG: alpha/beta fold hydrolase [Thiolinea sp.]
MSKRHHDYVEAGKEHGGIPIICLHGIGGNHASFAPQLQALSRHWHILAWNLPGYGTSPLLPDTDFASLSAALLDFMDQQDIAQAHLLGHSIGGMLAQETALRVPQRVASLALLATTSAFGGRDDQFRQTFLATACNRLQQGLSMAELAQRFVPGLLGPLADDEAREDAITSMAQIPETTYRAILACLVQFNRYREFATLGCPVCLLAGAKDRTAPPTTLEKMAQRLADVRFHVLPDAGHLLNLEAATTCNELLAEFYRSLTVARS